MQLTGDKPNVRRSAPWMVIKSLLLVTLLAPTLRGIDVPGNEDNNVACADLHDNDEDGLTDCDDPDCAFTNVCQDLSAKFAEVVLDLGTEIITKAYGVVQPTTQDLTVTGGCATGACGTYCGIPSFSVREYCGQHYVVQFPLSWTFSSASSGWSNCAGHSGSIVSAPVTDYTGPPVGTLVPETGQQLQVFHALAFPLVRQAWSMAATFLTPGGSSPTDQIKFVPAAVLEWGTTWRLHPYNDWIDLATVPAYFTISLAPTTGACCFASGDCAPIDRSSCKSSNGRFREGLTCAQAGCTPFGGACFFDFGGCVREGEEACTVALCATYCGPGTECPSDPATG